MNREARISARIVAMTVEESEDWQDALSTMASRLESLSDELGEDLEIGEEPDLDFVVRWRKLLEREQLNLDDEVLSREVDGMLEEVSRKLNEAEGEWRRHVDEVRRHNSRSKDLERGFRELAGKFKQLEKRS
jgi:uncharacterized protein YicC (UPF0701 family)